MKKLLFLVIMAVLLSSCMKMKITTSLPYDHSLSGKKLGIFPFMIAPIVQPKLPLIDAAAFNVKTNNLADEIMEAEYSRIDQMRSEAISLLGRHYNFQMLTIADLQDNPGLQILKSRHNYPEPLQTNNENFPVIIIPSGDFNPFNFRDITFPQFFNPTTPYYRPTVKYICQALGLDGLVVSYSYLNIIGVSGFGITGTIRLESFLYIFDSEGQLVSEGNVKSMPRGISGKYLDEYISCLQEYPLILEPLIVKLADSYQ